MKNLITCCAIAGLVVLAGCSGDSPTSNPLPTPAADRWAITELTASVTDPYVDVPVTVTATVTKNDAPAPDGTTVEFLAGTTLIDRVQTQGGSASVAYVSSAEGSVVVQARAVNAVASLTITWRHRDPSENLQVFLPVEPEMGDRDGGETVWLNGKAITPPVEVFFTVDGVTHQALTVEVTPSEPIEATGRIKITTPPITNIQVVRDGDGNYLFNDPTNENDPMYLAYQADIRVDVGIGTAKRFQTLTLSRAFTFLPEAVYVPEEPPPEPENVPGPEIYLVVPDRGDSRGGETVTILGREFGGDWDYDLEEVVYRPTDSVRVRFAGRNDLLGIDPLVSPDGHQIEVITPRFSTQPLTADQLVDVEVVNILDNEPGEGPDDNTFVKTGAFVFEADVLSPKITAIAPTAGPLDGGTVVTIFGRDDQNFGFELPVQVMFGDLEAIVNSVSRGEIVCVTPDFSDRGQQPPFTVNVSVTNITTGNEDTLAGAFTYGDNLFISGNSPSEGLPGTLVTIYGAGFEDPMTIDFLGDPVLRLENPAVSGSEVIARFPSDVDPVCNDVTASFRITLTERPAQSGIGFTEGGSFTYLGNTPTVISVDPSIVRETLDGAGVSPPEVTVSGLRFSDEVLVAIGKAGSNLLVLDNEDIEVVTDTQIDILQLPAPDEFQMDWNTGDCVTTDGLSGTRNVATPVDVRVTNIPGDCSDTLSGGLIYEPQDTECRVTPTISVERLGDFDPTVPGDCSDPVEFLVRNTGAGVLEVEQVLLTGPFQFEGDGQDYPGAPFNLAPFDQHSIFVEFCPETGTSVLVGTMAFYSNSGQPPGQPAGAPLIVDLQGALATSAIEFQPEQLTETDFPYVALGDCSPPVAVLVINAGDADLVFSASVRPGDDPPFQLDGVYEDVGVHAGESTLVGVIFCPEDDDGQLVSGVIEFESNDPNRTNYNYNVEARNPGNAIITVTPPAIAFGDQDVGDCTAFETVTVGNTGTTVLVFSATLGGANPNDFELDASYVGVTVSPGSTEQIGVRFCPTIDGPLSGEVVLVSNGGDVSVALTGVGIPEPVPVFTFAPAALDFGTLVNGGPSCTEHQPVNVTNSGGADLIFSAVLEGPHSNHFDFDDGATYNNVRLLPGETRPVYVRFCPDFTSLGLQPGESILLSDAWIQFTTNDLENENPRADLSGTAQEMDMVPAIDVSPTDIDFGQVGVGASDTRNITISNGGNADLTWSATLSGDTTQFSIDNPGGTIAAGATDTIVLTYAPTVAAVHNLVIQITHNAGAPVDVTVTGEGVTGPVFVYYTIPVTGPPPELDFGSLTNDGSGDQCTEHQAVYVRNDGAADLIFSAVLEGPHANHFDFDDGASYVDVRLLPFETRPVYVRFCPDFASLDLQPGESILLWDAWIQFTTNDPDNASPRADVSGTAGVPPSIQVTPTSLAFGNVTVATTADDTVVISNPSGSGATLTWSADVVGDAEFTIDISGGTIPAGSSTTVTVTFAPLANVAYSADLEISHNDPTEPDPITVGLSGSGVP